MPLSLLPAPGDAVPTFSDALEAAMDVRLTERLGRVPTDEERTDYRAVLWALAVAIRAIREEERHIVPSPPIPCPAPPSTRANPANQTTDRS